MQTAAPRGQLPLDGAEDTPLLTSTCQQREEPLHRESTRKRPASSGRKFAVMMGCWTLQFVTMGYTLGLSVMYVEVIRVFDSPRSQAALIQSVYMAVMAAGGLCWTGVIGKLGAGPTVILGGVIGFLGLSLSSLATNVPTIIVLTGLVAGAGMSIHYLCSFTVVSWMFHDNAGPPLAFMTIGAGLGLVATPAIFELLITQFQWTGTFLIAGAISLNSVVCGVLFHYSRHFFVTGKEGSVSKKRVVDLSVLKDVVLVFILVCSLLLTMTGPLESWFIVDIMVVRGYPRSVGSSFVSVTGFANLLGRMLGALLTRWCRIPPIYHWVYICPILGVSHALVAIVDGFWSIFGALVLNGISYGMTISQTPAIVHELAGQQFISEAISVLNIMYGLGDFLGGFLGGVVKDATGSYNLILYLGTVCSLLVSLSTVILLTAFKCTGTRRFRNQ